MKFVKRGDVSPEENGTPVDAGNVSAPQKNPNAAVLRYLIILFAVAFILIIFSFVMHQRSNAEVMSQLQSQVETIQQLQQIEVDYDKLKDDYNALEEQNTALTAENDASKKSALALELLYKCERLYGAGKYDECRDALAELAADDLCASLPDTAYDVGEGETAYETPKAAYERLLSEIDKK